MIINKLIDYHKYRLSNKNLIFKHIKVEVYISIVLIVVTAIAMSVSLVYKDYKIFLISFLLYAFVLIFINVKKNNVLLKKHKVVGKQNGISLTAYKVDQIKIFLSNEKFLSGEIVKKYMDYIDKEAINAKPSRYITLGIPGFLVALWVPVWNNFSYWYFNNDVITVKDGLFFIFNIFLFVVIIGIIIRTVMSLIKEFSESKYRRLKELHSLLELVYISIDEPVRDKDIYKNL